MKNPFSPGFNDGAPDIYLQNDGADEVEPLTVLQEAIENPKSPARSSLIMGIRGTGKTALMSQFSKKLPKSAVFIQTYSDEDMLDTIVGSLINVVAPTKAKGHLEGKVDLKILEISAGGEVERIEAPSTFYLEATALLRQIPNRLVVIAVDEIQSNTQSLVKLGKAFQLWQRSGFNVMLLMAGLQSDVEDLIYDESGKLDRGLTFLARSERIYLDTVSSSAQMADIYVDKTRKLAYPVPYEHALRLAKLTAGYPYLFQIYGYELWRAASEMQITDEVVENIIDRGRLLMNKNVFDYISKPLHKLQREYLVSVAEVMEQSNSKVAKSSDVAKHLDRKTSDLSRVRSRLIEMELLDAPNYNELTFTIPFAQQYFSDLHSQARRRTRRKFE